tara:strand:+ start:304 stop:678 length:375 start_codon:yes stop_codon:yes gene_type:complete
MAQLESHPEIRASKIPIYNGKPAINVLAIENEQGNLEKYHVWFYNNPDLGGITSFTDQDNADKVLEYIREHHDSLKKNPDESKRINSEFITRDLEKLVGSTALVKTSDGRIKVGDKYYRENIFT